MDIKVLSRIIRLGDNTYNRHAHHFIIYYYLLGAQALANK